MKTLKQILTENTTIEKKLGEEHLFHEPHHLKAIDQYTNYSHQQMNSSLWNKYVHDYPIRKDDQKNINDLDEVTKLHKTTEPMNVYSKSKHDPREKANFERIMHHPAFLSTSTRKEVAEDFGTHQVKKNNETGNIEEHHHLYNIHVPSGSHGAYVENYSKHDEKEFILPKGTNLKYIKTDTKKDDFKPNTTFYHEHHLEVAQ